MSNESKFTLAEMPFQLPNLVVGIREINDHSICNSQLFRTLFRQIKRFARVDNDFLFCYHVQRFETRDLNFNYKFYKIMIRFYKKIQFSFLRKAKLSKSCGNKMSI